MIKFTRSMTTSVVLGMALAAVLASIASMGQAHPVGGTKGADFNIGPNETKTWVVPCDGSSTLVNVTFSEFTTMKLDVTSTASDHVVDADPGTFYQVRVERSGPANAYTLTIRLTNLGPRAYSGHITVN